jgi:hypothetical protein
MANVFLWTYVTTILIGHDNEAPHLLATLDRCLITPTEQRRVCVAICICLQIDVLKRWVVKAIGLSFV